MPRRRSPRAGPAHRRSRPAAARNRPRRACSRRSTRATPDLHITVIGASRGRCRAARQVADRQLDRARDGAVVTPLVRVAHVEQRRRRAGLASSSAVAPPSSSGRIERLPPPACPCVDAALEHARDPVVADAEELGRRLDQRPRKRLGEDQHHGRSERDEPADVRRERLVELDVERAREVARRRTACAPGRRRRGRRRRSPLRTRVGRRSTAGMAGGRRTTGPARLMRGHLARSRWDTGRAHRAASCGSVASSSIARSGLKRRSCPIVEVRRVVCSGRPSRSCRRRGSAVPRRRPAARRAPGASGTGRAVSSSVGSGPSRSVRPALPTSRLPPVAMAAGPPPSAATSQARCSGV